MWFSTIINTLTDPRRLCILFHAGFIYAQNYFEYPIVKIYDFST